jgi:hypothetical protein
MNKQIDTTHDTHLMHLGPRVALNVVDICSGVERAITKARSGNVATKEYQLRSIHCHELQTPSDLHKLNHSTLQGTSKNKQGCVVHNKDKHVRWKQGERIKPESPKLSPGDNVVSGQQ